MNEWLPIPVEPEAAGRVRRGVFRRIRRRRLAWRAALLVPLLAILPWPQPPELETLALQAPPAPAAPAVARAKLAPVWRARVLAPPAEKIVLYTNDPDVVIVLVSEGGGE